MRETNEMWLIIPCGADKLDHAAPARDLYTSSMFRMALAAATSEAEGCLRGGLCTSATILVLSARHGLMDLDTVVEPYDTKMGDPESITVERLATQVMARAAEHDFDVDAYSFVPKAYFEVLDEALRASYIYAADVYEATCGIGEHRKVCRIVRDTEYTYEEVA